MADIARLAGEQTCESAAVGGGVIVAAFFMSEKGIRHLPPDFGMNVEPAEIVRSGGDDAVALRGVEGRTWGGRRG